MNMKKSLISLLLIISAFSFLNAQTVNGVVKVQKANGEVEPLASASVYWLEGNLSLISNEDGSFSFDRKKSENVSLIAAYIGHVNDTLVLGAKDNSAELILRENAKVLGEVKVHGRQKGNYLSKITPVKTEVISASGLCKMACCNLAESFENSASVTVGYSDAITGARQIRLLGLSGQYTQMLDENRPVMRGIAAPFGLSYVPGQWLESIQIAKGPSSVVNGLEAISGQINLEHRKPTTEKPFFINLYTNSDLMTEANIASSLQLNKKLSTVILGHFSNNPTGHDGNGDGFRDEPLSTQFNFANRWLYIAENGVQVRLGFKALSDDRVGGSCDYEKDSPRDLNLWGSRIKNKGLNGYLKVGVPLNADNSKNIATIIDFNHHRLDSWFGPKDYNAEQNSGFFNLMFQNTINDNHKYILGLSGQYDKVGDVVKNHFMPADFIDCGREEMSLGGYGEYTYTQREKMTIVAGLRLENNNLHGWLFSPRANVKYSLTDDIIVRASGGRGFRSSDVIADNLGMLSTGRRIKIENNLDMEDAWTYGANITKTFPLGQGEDASLSFDYFRTDFNKQIIVDQERNLDYIWLYNLDGRSFTNTYQFDFSLEPIKRFTILATYKYTDAKVTMAGQGLVEKPLTSRYKGVLNLQYATRMNKWTFDFTTQVNGPSKLYSFCDKKESPVYTILFAQVTKKFKDLDVYVGVDNLTNYRQKNAIINADDPFSPGFNSSVIWGPLMGRKVYAGLRFTIWK